MGTKYNSVSFRCQEDSAMTTIIQYFAWFDLFILGSIAMLVLLSLYGDRTT
jgi:hypothetical protein